MGFFRNVAGKGAKVGIQAHTYNSRTGKADEGLDRMKFGICPKCKQAWNLYKSKGWLCRNCG